MNEVPLVNNQTPSEVSSERTMDELKPKNSFLRWLIWSLGWIGLLGFLAFGISLLTASAFSFLIFFICTLIGGFLVAFFALGFIFSWKNKTTRWKVLRWADISGLAFVAFVFVFRCFLPQELQILNGMARNYEKHQNEMADLLNYTRNACDTPCYIGLEWEFNKLSRFHIQVEGQESSCNWNVPDTKRDSLMASVGLTKDELETIRKKMKDCHCIWLEIHDSQNYYEQSYCSLGYKRVGFGAYSYRIFDAPPSDSFQKELAEDRQLVRYNERVFFEYGGGAIGPDTFEPDIKKKFLKRHKSQSKDMMNFGKTSEKRHEEALNEDFLYQPWEVYSTTYRSLSDSEIENLDFSNLKFKDEGMKPLFDSWKQHTKYHRPYYCTGICGKCGKHLLMIYSETSHGSLCSEGGYFIICPVCQQEWRYESVWMD